MIIGGTMLKLCSHVMSQMRDDALCVEGRAWTYDR
jgi:hypothetical protein